MTGIIYLSQTRGLDSFRTGPRDEHGCRGGGAIGIAESRELVFRCCVSCASPETSQSVGQDPALLWPPAEGSSGPTAPCRANSAAACSTSRVGDAGGDMRGLRLVDAPERSFSNPFFSFCEQKAVLHFRTKAFHEELNTSFLQMSPWSERTRVNYEEMLDIVQIITRVNYENYKRER